jgi:hypothetical protein
MSVAYEEEKRQLLQRQAEVEAEKEKYRNEARIQAEAARVLQSTLPTGTGFPVAVA